MVNENVIENDLKDELFRMISCLSERADDVLSVSDISDKIDISYMQEQLDTIMERKEILKRHKYKIWKGKDGCYYTYIPDLRKGRILKKRTTKKALIDFLVDFWEKNSNVSFEKLFYEWAKEKLEYGEIKRQTFTRYEFDYKRFFEGKAIASADVRTITEEDLKAFIKKTIKEQDLTHKGYDRLRTIIRGPFMYAKDHGYTDISISGFFADLNLSKKTFRKVVKKKEELVFTLDEVKKLESYTKSVGPLPIDLGIMLAFQTGVRVGELAALQWSDLNGEILHVWKTEVTYKDDDDNYINTVQESPKTAAGDREVILNSKAQDILKKVRRINPFGEYIFMKDGKRINEKAFGYRIHRLCEEVGISERSMHKARATCATTMLNAGVNESLIILQLGHTTIDVTKDYYYYDNSGLKEAKEQLERAVL